MRRWTRPGRTVAVVIVVASLALPATRVGSSAVPAQVAQELSPAMRQAVAGPVAVTVATVGMVPHLVAPVVPEVPAILRPFGAWLWVIRADAARYGLPASLVEALAMVESRGDAQAVSSTGALGPLQIEPATAAWLGLPVTTTAEQIRAGVAYLGWIVGYVGVSAACLQAGPGGSAACSWSTDEVLSAFYAGPSGRYASGYVSDVRSYWVQTKGAMAA